MTYIEKIEAEVSTWPAWKRNVSFFDRDIQTKKEDSDEGGVARPIPNKKED
jgi:hypothetical protein